MQEGQTIAGKYRLNRMIGSGGMASVWAATNIFTERAFAIKVMLPQVARTPESARRFLLEAKVSARIDHPSIIEVIDVGQAEDGSLFLVMELLTGQSLETAIRHQRPPMRVADFTRMMHDCARALAAAHKSGVVHRDLKPTNIFLHKDREGNAVAKILDFGVSKIIEEETNHALTVAGTVLGSPLYMSPEQAMGASDIDGRTDIFAFGSILFEAMGGVRAFDAPNFNALIVTIATKQPKAIDVVAPSMPESLRSIVRECMKTDREARIGSFDEIADRLAAALPALEGSEQRLPTHFRASTSDADETNALPIMDAGNSMMSAAAEQQAAITGPPRSGNSPPQAFSAPWPTETVRTAPRNRKWPVVVGILGAVFVLSLVGFYVISLRGESPTTSAGASPPAATPSAQALAASASATPSAEASAEPPVVNVDSLPVASNKTTARPGQLSIAASPGWCSVVVDGEKKGATPVATVNLPPGPHRVECTPPNGKTRVASVQVQPGQPTRYRFSLDN